MPIDITLLRSTEDGGNINEVKRWQLCRLKKQSKGSEDDIQALIIEIANLEKDRRRLLKESCQCRAKLRHLQSLLAPKKKCPNDKPTSKSSCAEKSATTHLDNGNHGEIEAIRGEITILKKKKIPSLTHELDRRTKMLEMYSSKLMNIVVDGKSFPELCMGDIDRNRLNTVDQASEALLIDPLYCIGAYEKVSFPTDEESALIAGFGSIVSDALHMYAKKFIQHFDIVEQGHLQYLDVPETIVLQSSSLVHSVMGYREGIVLGYKDKSDGFGTSDSNNSTFVVPSYIVNAMVHQNKTFTDRELPKMYISSTDVVSEEINVGYKKLPLARSAKQIQAFTLCTSNVSLSTEAQDGIVENITAFYLSLITTSADIMNVTSKIRHLYPQCSRETPLLRRRSAMSYELEPNEARRITIEGFLPSSNSYVYLGHVSNYTDYISRALKIKCGGGHGQPTEYVHLIHGTIMCCHGALQWITENNIASRNVENDTTSSVKEASSFALKQQQNGILISPSLAKFMNVGTTSKKDSSSMLFIPFVRELVRRKGGKISAKDYVKGTGDPIWLHSQDITFKHEDNRDHYTDTTEEKEVARNIKLELPSVKDEAACNPYDFLPLYQN